MLQQAIDAGLAQDQETARQQAERMSQVHTHLDNVTVFSFNDDFADFWIRIEGPWLSRHAYYESSQGCFPSRISRSRRYALMEAGLSASFLSVFVALAIEAVKAIA